MPELRPDIVVRSVEALLAEKESVSKKETKLVQSLNAVLKRMGYEVRKMSSSDAARGRRGRPPGRRPGRGPGRPPKATSGLGKRTGRKPMSTAARRAVSKRMKAYWAKRKATAKRRAA